MLRPPDIHHVRLGDTASHVPLHRVRERDPQISSQSNVLRYFTPHATSVDDMREQGEGSSSPVFFSLEKSFFPPLYSLELQGNGQIGDQRVLLDRVRELQRESSDPLLPEVSQQSTRQGAGRGPRVPHGAPAHLQVGFPDADVHGSGDRQVRRLDSESRSPSPAQRSC